MSWTVGVPTALGVAAECLLEDLTLSTGYRLLGSVLAGSSHGIGHTAMLAICLQ
jgi:hypothetical protein